MPKIFRWVVALTLLFSAASNASAGELKLTLNNGLVTIVADEVPVSRILAEWARLGQTQIVNGEKVMTVVSLQLVDVPEKKALEILLRSASGYMAAERPTPMAGASAFDRIMILPYSRPPAQSAVPVNTSMPPAFNQPPPRPMQPEPDDDPVLPPGVMPQTNPNAPAGPQTMPSPGMLPGGPANQQQPVLTSPRPGQLPTPGPQQPVPFGTPTAPGQPPVKPPGGGSGH